METKNNHVTAIFTNDFSKMPFEIPESNNAAVVTFAVNLCQGFSFLGIYLFSSDNHVLGEFYLFLNTDVCCLFCFCCYFLSFYRNNHE